jgi:hypothetical protein
MYTLWRIPVGVAVEVTPCHVEPLQPDPRLHTGPDVAIGMCSAPPFFGPSWRSLASKCHCLVTAGSSLASQLNFISKSVAGPF